jgi:hypothetical protein
MERTLFHPYFLRQLTYFTCLDHTGPSAVNLSPWVHSLSFRLDHSHTAVDVERLPGDVSTFVARQVECPSCNIKG